MIDNLSHLSRGRVSLIGAGPGDPELLTMRGYRVLRDADVVFYDYLVSAEILALCGAATRRVCVGKSPHGPSTSQEVIHALMIKEARSGANVVRLKGGDPFVFGRGGEEVLALRERGIEVDVVPGVSSCIAVPASAGIPVTHRGVSTHFSVVTGADATLNDDQLASTWAHLARAGGTLVFLMGVRALPRIVDVLVRAGLSTTLPAAVIARGTTPDQQVVAGTLETIAARCAREDIRSHAVIVVGDVVRLREELVTFASSVVPYTDESWSAQLDGGRARSSARG